MGDRRGSPLSIFIPVSVSDSVSSQRVTVVPSRIGGLRRRSAASGSRSAQRGSRRSDRRRPAFRESAACPLLIFAGRLEVRDSFWNGIGGAAPVRARRRGIGIASSTERQAVQDGVDTHHQNECGVDGTESFGKSDEEGGG